MNFRKSNAIAREDRLIFQRRRRVAVHAKRFLGDLSFRVYQNMERPAGRYLIDDFDSADFDNPISFARIDARRFGVKNDFTHLPRPSKLCLGIPRRRG